MSHTPHELAEEFPEHADKIHGLKTSDAHFAKMAEDYHTLNRAVHRAETDVEPTVVQKSIFARLFPDQKQSQRRDHFA